MTPSQQLIILTANIALKIANPHVQKTKRKRSQPMIYLRESLDIRPTGIKP